VDSDGFGAEKNADVQRNSNTGFKKNSNKLEIEWDSVYIYGVVGFVSYHILYHTWIKTGILWASFLRCVKWGNHRTDWESNRIPSGNLT
jgi:hypothetical protein